MSIWLTPEQLARTRPAERTNFATPVPTRVVSNGEWVPPPQSRGQKRVEQALAEVAERNGRRLGLSRREFLRTSAGMAAAFMAMNQVYGVLFDVDPAEAADPGAAKQRLDALARQPIIDVQLHFVRDDFAWDGILALGEYAKHWNPILEKEGVTLQRYKFDNFLKEVFLDSQTWVGLVSSAPSDNPNNVICGNHDLARARRIVNGIAGTRRLMCHAVIAPGQKGWLDDIDRAIATVRPDGWKGYTVGDPLAHSEFPWRMDDEKLMYPAYEKMQKSGIRNVCIHKGLMPADYEKSFPHWRYAMVDDVAKAAKDWPGLNFVIYHAGLKPFLMPPDENLAQFEKKGRMDWVTDLAEIPGKHGVTNVYAEIGTSFASSAVTHPRHAAAFLGTLIRGMGADHVIWGTDSVWYGSPQWQIEAMRRIEIPEDMRKKHGFQPLGPADGLVKGAIFAYNASRVYAVDLTPPAIAMLDGDGLAAMRREYLAAGAAPSNLAYGFVAKGDGNG